MEIMYSVTYEIYIFACLIPAVSVYHAIDKNIWASFLCTGNDIINIKIVLTRANVHVPCFL